MIPSFGDKLRTYRRGAGQAQLDAALSAGISQRHLSFLETGRAQPSRGVVLALGGTLGLSLSQQNELLLAAGFAPMFRPEGRDRKDLELIERALLAFLESHEPFPAILLEDGVWIKKGNRGAARLWSAVRGMHIPEVPRDNVFDLMLRRGPGRERLENWSEATACLLRHFLAEQARFRRPDLVETVAALYRHPARAAGATAQIPAGRRRAVEPLRGDRQSASTAGYAPGGAAGRAVHPGGRGDSGVVPAVELKSKMQRFFRQGS
jgi:transcriptional regulator with XRE-family HTH domain